MNEYDWRNPNDYKYLDDADNNKWAWEFLRRSKKYRDDYEKYRGFPSIDDVEKFRNSQGFSRYYIGDPEILANETYGEYMDRCMKRSESEGREGPGCAIDSIIGNVADEYCLVDESLPNPDCSDVPELYFPNLIYFNPDLDFGHENVVKMLRRKPEEESRHIACYFNLEYPLDDQITMAAERLLELQQYMTKNGHLKVIDQRATKGMYVRYLRLLDALNEKAGEEEMMDAIYPKGVDIERSTLTGNMKSARELSEGRHRILLYKK